MPLGNPPDANEVPYARSGIIAGGYPAPLFYLAALG